MATIVIAEDDPGLCDLLARELAANGHAVLKASTGTEALARFQQGPVALALLDVMLPEIDGFEVCRRIRAVDATVPLIMLTARDHEIDRVVGLEVGADDYVVKPFSVRELMARVKGHLRKADAYRAMATEPAMPARALLSVADCTLDPLSRAVTVLGGAVALSRREFDLLEILMRHPGRVLTREWLLETVWGDDYDGNDRTVDTHMLRLRDKLGRESTIASRLSSVRGVGYRLALE